jgi:hypothetical protein
VATGLLGRCAGGRCGPDFILTGLTSVGCCLNFQPQWRTQEGLHAMSGERDIAPTEHLANVRSHLVGDLLHLRRLWISVQQASAVLERASVAYLESRSLLERINGAARSPIICEIRPLE